MPETQSKVITCQECGRPIREPSRGMCGNCYRIWQRDHFPPNATCEVCGRGYFRRACASPNGRTCSKKCYAVWKRGRDHRNRPTDGAQPVRRHCEWCGREFTTEMRQVKKGLGRFCSLQCSALRRRNDPARSKYPENAWRARMGFPKVAKRLLRAPDARCAECGERRTSGNLVVHHPVPPNGDRELLLAPWNLVILCRACHLEVHRNGVLEAVA